MIDRYLHWFELLIDSLDDVLIHRSKVQEWLAKDLKVAPTLRALADPGQLILSSLSEAGLLGTAGACWTE
jgi:hypothetical protein